MSLQETELMKMPIQGKNMPLTGKNYAAMAEYLVREYMKDPQRSKTLTTTKLRGIYAMIMNVYTQINVPEDFGQHLADIQYLKVRMAYECGREPSVKDFLEHTHLMKALDKVTTFDTFMLYCRYAESLVAYFKFFGGRD
jgi:CRISPR-associated protein Csm2